MASEEKRSTNPEFYQAKGDIPLWKIADKVGVTDVTLGRWLRKPLPENKKDQLLAAISELKS